MLIYKLLYESLNKSLQIIRWITINNRNSQRWTLCYKYNVDFSKKCGRPVGGGSENSMPQKFKKIKVNFL